MFRNMYVCMYIHAIIIPHAAAPVGFEGCALSVSSKHRLFLLRVYMALPVRGILFQFIRHQVCDELHGGSSGRAHRYCTERSLWAGLLSQSVQSCSELVTERDSSECHLQHLQQVQDYTMRIYKYLLTCQH